MINKTKMKKLSDALNTYFGVLNSLTGEQIFHSCVLPHGNLEVEILGRDAEFNNEFECEGSGLWLVNPLLDKLKRSKQ